MDLSIVDFRTRPEFSQQILAWQRSEWESRPLYFWMLAVERGVIAPETYPQLYVGLLDSNAVGCVALVRDDMDTEGPPEANPWLGHLYDVPQFRGHGIGARLFAHAEGAAKVLGERFVYLFTSNIEELASGRGWQAVRRQHFEGEDVVVMRKELRQSISGTLGDALT